MMPVLRVSDTTWERLKAHARPLEDTVDDVMSRALDALDAVGKGVPPTPTVKPKAKRSRGNKLPQKEFRTPLLLTLLQLGGEGHVSDVRKVILPRVSARLQAADYQPVSTGEPRWWNAVCWERMDMVRLGLLEASSKKGVWKLSQKGAELANASRG